MVPLGGSPRKAMMFSTPSSCNRDNTSSSSSLFWPTQVRWAITSTSVFRLISNVISSVKARVEPPAP